MRQIGYRHQRTLAQPTCVQGVGFVTGAKSRIRFLPAPADTGVAFVRTDLPYRPLTPALAARVTNTARRTTLGTHETGVTLVEHALAALAGLRVDNCVVELDAAEPPGLDGSAGEFVDALSDAGVVLQSARRPIWTPSEPVTVTHGGATIALYPATTPGVRASYILDYGTRSPIPRQQYTLGVTPESFAREVAASRTFLLEHEAHALRRAGVGRHLTTSELLVFGPSGVIGNRLRHADEPARHKLLDLVGDLALCGFDIAGHLVAYRSGHTLNVHLARTLSDQVAAATEFDGVIPFRGFGPAARPARAA